MKELTLESKRVMTLIDRPPHDFSQDVVAPVVARKDAVGNRERGRPRVISNHAHRKPLLGLRLVMAIGEFGTELNDRTYQIRVVAGLNALQHGGDTLESSARVNRRSRQRIEFVLPGRNFTAIELHEDQVPDLHDRVARPVDVGGRILDIIRMLAHVVMNLAAWTTRTGLAHLPEVIFATEAQDAFARCANLFP